MRKILGNIDFPVLDGCKNQKHSFILPLKVEDAEANLKASILKLEDAEAFLRMLKLF